MEKRLSRVNKKKFENEQKQNFEKNFKKTITSGSPEICEGRTNSKTNNIVSPQREGCVLRTENFYPPWSR